MIAQRLRRAVVWNGWAPTAPGADGVLPFCAFGRPRTAGRGTSVGTGPRRNGAGTRAAEHSARRV